MEITMKIQGMMCMHCEARVKKALEALPGVIEAIPDHANANAKIKAADSVDKTALRAAVEGAGYKVLAID